MANHFPTGDFKICDIQNGEGYKDVEQDAHHPCD